MNSIADLLEHAGKRRRVLDMVLLDAELAGVDLSCLVAERLSLIEASLYKACLTQIRWVECDLTKARLSYANLTDAVLRMCRFDNASVRNACFERARFEDCFCKGADFSMTNFRSACMSETAFERAILRDAIFDGASGDGIIFRGADLTGASLVGVRFRDADFRGADLRKANLKDGVFRHADFRGALLEGVDFSGTDCSGAYFDSEEEAYAAPSAAAEPSLQELQALLTNLVQQAQQGTTPKSPLLDELMKKAGVGQGAAPTNQAALLGRILATVHDLEAHAEAPEVLVQRCQAILRDVLPQLDDTLGDADWQALSKILSGLQGDASNRHADRD